MRALSAGPAASLVLSADAGPLRVHSIFPSAINLRAIETERFVSLCGAGGRSFPHAIVLERPVDFTSWQLLMESTVHRVERSIQLETADGIVMVDLEQAERSPSRTLPTIPRLGDAHRACTTRLAELQATAGCELRIDALGRAGGVKTYLGARLCELAQAFGAAATAFAESSERNFPVSGRPRGGSGERRASLRQAVASLVGLGPGLTPTGDDFLCGFMAAARSADRGLREADREHRTKVAGRSALCDALEEALQSNLDRTGTISAFLVRCAIQGFWPTPLVDLAEALSRQHERDALLALDELCRLGHSSGSDLATGYLFGLKSLASADSWRFERSSEFPVSLRQRL